jgi:hypothetical protein
MGLSTCRDDFEQGLALVTFIEALIGRVALGYGRTRLSKDDDRQTVVLLQRPTALFNAFTFLDIGQYFVTVFSLVAAPEQTPAGLLSMAWDHSHFTF